MNSLIISRPILLYHNDLLFLLDYLTTLKNSIRVQFIRFLITFTYTNKRIESKRNPDPE